MLSINRISPYNVVAFLVFFLMFYYAYYIRHSHYGLEGKIEGLKEALSVSEQKNKVLVKDAREKISNMKLQVAQLQQESLMKHKKLGERQEKLATLKTQLKFKQKQIKQLHELASDNKVELSQIAGSVSKSKSLYEQLLVKAEKLMLEYKKLMEERTRLQKLNAKLQNDLNEEKIRKKEQDKQLAMMKKDKEDLSTKVDNLRKKDEIIQKTIQQKIKESYAARMMQSKHKPTNESRQSVAVDQIRNNIHKPVESIPEVNDLKRNGEKTSLVNKTYSVLSPGVKRNSSIDGRVTTEDKESLNQMS